MADTAMRWRLFPPIHELASALRFVGLRDRLRCPECGAVGTWKPHGAWLDRRDERKLARDPKFKGEVRHHVRRWLCKWCGWYVGPEGVQRCVVEPGVAWALPWDYPDGTTPEQVLKESEIPRTNPWGG